jgi:hypothetical protein
MLSTMPGNTMPQSVVAADAVVVSQTAVWDFRSIVDAVPGLASLLKQRDMIAQRAASAYGLTVEQLNFEIGHRE